MLHLVYFQPGIPIKIYKNDSSEICNAIPFIKANYLSTQTKKLKRNNREMNLR